MSSIEPSSSNSSHADNSMNTVSSEDATPILPSPPPALLEKGSDDSSTDLFSPRSPDSAENITLSIALPPRSFKNSSASDTPHKTVNSENGSIKLPSTPSPQPSIDNLSRSVSRIRLPLSRAFLTSIASLPRLESTSSSVQLEDGVYQCPCAAGLLPPPVVIPRGRRQSSSTQAPSQPSLSTPRGKPYSPTSKQLRPASPASTTTPPSLTSSPTLTRLSTTLLSLIQSLDSSEPPSTLSLPPQIRSPFNNLNFNQHNNSSPRTSASSTPSTTSSPSSPVPLSPSISSRFLSTTSFESAVEYLESLCQYIQELKASIYTKLTSYRHQQVCAVHAWLPRIEQRQADIIESMTKNRFDEKECRAKLDELALALDKAKKTARLSTAIPAILALPSSMSPQEVAKLRVQRDLLARTLEVLLAQRSSIQQQLLALSTVAQELRTSSDHPDWPQLYSAIKSSAFVLCMGQVYQEELLLHIRNWERSTVKSMEAQAQLLNISITEQEVRNRLDELIVMHWQ